MKHNINELYNVKYENKKILATKELAQTMLNINGVTAHHCTYHINNNKPVKVKDIKGDRLIYLYGEKTWFDTEAERDEYKAIMNEQRAKETERNKIKNAIIAKLNEMTADQLQALLEQI